jgi:capsular polysaccharide transport system permease protein
MVADDSALEASPAPEPTGFLPSRRAFLSQIRLIKALILRDMMTQFSETRLGYLWRIIIPVLGIVIFSLVRNLRGTKMLSPYFPMGVFLATGIPFWFAFREAYQRVLTATDRNDPLLMVPHITVLDMVISRAIAELFASLWVFLVIAVGASVIWNDPPAYPARVMLLYLCAGWLGAAMGLVMCPIHRMFPIVSQILNMFLRIGMWISGIAFTIYQMPRAAWPWLAWNPILHITEGARQYWSPQYQSPIFSLTYVLGVAAALTGIGLLLERGSRRFMGS